MDFNGVSVDKNSPIPLYYQLKQILIKKIQDGEFSSGDALPTELELGNLFNISRTTIRQAINELVMEGHLYKIKNKGTFVAKQKIVQRFMQDVTSYGNDMEHQGISPRTEMLDISLVDPPQNVYEGLGLPQSGKLIRIFRRRFANDEPILIVENFLSIHKWEIFEQDFEKNSLYKYLAQDHDTAIVKLTRCIEAAIAGKEESELLGIPMGYPILLATSTGFNCNGKPIEYSVVRYRGDKNRFIVDFHVKLDE